MTAAFGLGQIVGPLIGAALVGSNNNFLPPTIMASSVLALSAVLLVPLLGRRTA
jgi:fucose permease